MNKNNNNGNTSQQTLRRTLAFIAAISFTCFSGSSEFNSIIGAEDTPSTSASGSTSDTDVPAVTTVVTSVSEAPQTTVADTESSAEAVSSADVTSVSTTPVTSETSAVTTTEDASKKCNINITFEGNISNDGNDAKNAINALFSDKNLTPKGNDKNFSIEYTFSDSCKNTADLIEQFKSTISLPDDSGTKYLHVFRSAGENEHLYKIDTETSDNNIDITLSLCYILTTNTTGFNHDGKLTLSNNDVSIEGIIQYGGYYYVEKEAKLNISINKERYFVEGTNDKSKEITIEHPNANGYVSLYLEYKDYKVTLGRHFNGNHPDPNPKEVKFEEANLNLTLDNPINIPLKFKINNAEHNIPTVLGWTDKYQFDILEIPESGIEYDVILSKKNDKGKDEIIYKSLNQKNNGFTLNFDNKDNKDNKIDDVNLSQYKNQNNITITLKVRPRILSISTAESEELISESTIEVPVSDGIIMIPNFIYDNTGSSPVTNYLSKIYIYGSDAEENNILDFMTAADSSDTELKKFKEFKEYDFYNYYQSIYRLIYKPFDINEDDSANIISQGQIRNDNCRTALYKSKSFRYIFLWDKSSNVPDPSAVLETVTDEDSLQENDQYFVLYKDSIDDFLKRTNMNGLFAERASSFLKSKYIKIITLYKINIDDDNNKTIVEIPLSSSDKLFYCDARKPEISNTSLSIGGKKLSNGEWTNGTAVLNFDACDTDNVIKGEDADTLNTLSENYSQIASVTIGRYDEEKEKFESAFEFTKRGNTWKLSPSVSKASDLPYSVAFTSYESKDKKAGFSFNITPQKSFIDEKITFTVTDLSGNVSYPANLDLRIDTQPPVLTDSVLRQIIKGEKNKLISSPDGMVYKNESDSSLFMSAAASDEDIFQKNEYIAALEAFNKNKAEALESAAAADDTEDEVISGIIDTAPMYVPKGSGINKIEAEYIYGDKTEAFIQTNKESKALTMNSEFSFSPDSCQNTSGIIKITVTDNAGNPSEYYYSTRDITKVKQSADTVIFDKKPPEAKFVEPSPDYTDDNQGEKWFKDFPKDLRIKAYDESTFTASDKYRSSGLSTLNISVNGETQNISIASKQISTADLENGSYSLIFKPVSGEKNLEVLLADSNSDSEISLFTTTQSADNRYNIKMSVTDFANNKSIDHNTDSKEAEYSFAIDNTKPEVDAVYKIKHENNYARKFGTYFGKKATIEVTVNDNGVSSGMNGAILKFNDTEIETADIRHINDNCYIFTFHDIPEDFEKTKIINSRLELITWDNVGNTNDNFWKHGNYLVNSEGSDILVFEAVPPVIKQSIREADYRIEEKDQNWYNSDVTITYSVSDNDSGIASLSGYTEHSGYRTTPEDPKDFTGKNTITPEYELQLSTESDDKNHKDGKFEFHIKASDNAGNNTPDNNYIVTTVYKDITDPEVTGFIFNDNEYDNEYQSAGPQIPFYHFSNSDTVRVVRVFAEDKNASSGINDIKLKLIYPDGTTDDKLYSDPLKFSQEEGYYKDFIIPRNFKGTLAAKAVDNVGNTPDGWVTPKGYVHETADRHQAETNPYEIVLPETEYRDIKGNRLYNHDIDAAITVKDTVSGIKDISIINSNGEKNLHTDLNGSDLPEGWVKENSDINLPTRISTVITQSNNKNYNEISLTATDYSGNQIKSEEPVIFSIDKTKPTISVSFDNNTPDSTYNSYYKSARTATIRITERNFSASKVSTSYPVTGEWKLVSGPETEGTDNAVYQNTVSFTDDGTYRLTVNCSDICDNPAANSFDSGEFTIDLTLPEIKVTYDNNSSLNSNYYNSKRTAYVEINDLNFESSRVNITGTVNGSSEAFPVVNGQIRGNALTWENVSGNIWRAAVPMTEDGIYSINVSASDKAGNNAVPYHSEFNIDTKAPVISFSGTEDKHAYNNEAKPVITIADTNIDPDSISVNMTGSRNKDSVQLDGTLERSDGKFVFTADDIPHTAEYDDIYTITAQASDLAGNRASSEIKISVNRFGSTFEPDEQSALLSNTTVREAKDIVIREINPDMHPSDFSPTVRVTKNGSNTVLKESSDFIKELSTESSTGWFEYTYTIKSDIFSDDGVYEISIYTEDNAANKNYSDSILKFNIDKTRPSVNYLTIEPGGIYKTESKQVTAILNDNLEIDPDSIKVFVNSDQLDKNAFSYDEKTSEISFAVRNLNSTQYVEIMAADMAGNQLDPVQAKIENLFISTSSARILLHKTWFKIAASAAGIAALASGAFIILKKKKKNTGTQSK